MTNSTALKIHQLLYQYQRRNQFLGQVNELPITPLESHILVEIDGAALVNREDLVDFIEIPKSTIVRSVSDLEDRQLLKERPARDDKRIKWLELTKSGKDLLEEHDKASDHKLYLFSSKLSTKELRLLKNHLNRLNKGLNSPASVERKTEHTLRSTFRSLARGMGILSGSFMGSDLNSTQWQILRTIHEQTGPSSATQIEHKLKIDQSTVSRVITSLEKKGLICKEKSKEDKRYYNLTLSKKGVSAIAKSDAIASEKISKAITGLKAVEKSDFINLLESFVLGSNQDRPEEGLIEKESFEVQLIRTELQFKNARAFLIEQMYRILRHDEFAETILNKDNHCYQLLFNNSLAAVCEIIPCGKEWILQHFACLESERITPLVYRFLNAVIEEILFEKQARSIEAPEDSYAALFLRNKDKDQSKKSAAKRVKLSSSNIREWL